MKKRVVVGLSGGVDSSVAAYLLKKEGYDVIALFMINWHDSNVTLKSECHWHDDLLFAEMVTKKLKIPLQTVDFSVQYKKRIVDYMFEEYQRGRTPNPDVLCNKEIKFDLFLNKALELDADFIATGHYCRNETNEGVSRLLKGADNNKEQSYFLCRLNQYQIGKTLFPIGHLHKQEVRNIAEEQGLATATRKDSQGLCFVGKVDLPTFLQQKLKPKKGNVVEIAPDNKVFIENNPNPKHIYSAFNYKPEFGTVVGEHNGAHYFTVGQRKGINIGGKKDPLFVIATDTEKNIIYVGQGQNHPGLFRKGLTVKKNDIHWLNPETAMNKGESREMDVRIRYRQPVQKATLHMNNDDDINILFNKEQRGITPGQFAVWYSGDELMGSGIIFE